MLLLPAIAAISGPLLAGIPTPVAGISWSGDWDAAFEQARGESKVVLLAINMDGEKANDRMAEDVYSDKEVIALTQQTVNLIGSRFEHGGKCKRFSGVECTDHQQMEKHIRADILQVTPQTDLVAPQHIFADAEGKILLSVPYEISAREQRLLVNCDERHDELIEGAAHRRLVEGFAGDHSITAAALHLPLLDRLLIGVETDQ